MGIGSSNLFARHYFVLLDALVQTFVKYFVNINGDAPEFLPVLVSFYIINVIFDEIFNGIIEKMQE